jgi:carbonic anhydrase
VIRKNLFEQTDSDRSLELLKEGNRRFMEGMPQSRTVTVEARRLLAQKGQTPFAVILGCSDSRVPPEIIFDVGAGQIFVVRTAGNVADATAIGSVEFAVEQLHTRLVVVLGHNDCGAVAVAVSGGDYGPNIGAILSEIGPSVEKLCADDDGADAEPATIFYKSEDKNILNTAAKLTKSAIIRKYLDNGALKIICAKYDLETGEVCFFK